MIIWFLMRGIVILGLIWALGVNSIQSNKKLHHWLKNASGGEVSPVLALTMGNTLLPVSSLEVRKFPVYGDLIEEILLCESGNKHYNPDGTIKKGKAGEIGIAQFMPETWREFNKIRGTNLDIYNEEDQKSMIVWAFENGLQKNWSCYKKIVKW